jgi:hypothetical protein
MDHPTQAGTVRARAGRGGWRVLAAGLLIVLAGACAADPEPSAPFDGVAVARAATTTSPATTSSGALAQPSSSSVPATTSTTAAVPASNELAIAAGPVATTPAPAPVVATAEATASPIDDTLAQVDALLDDVDRDLADTSDS